jgi:hypothetical protein
VGMKMRREEKRKKGTHAVETRMVWLGRYVTYKSRYESTISPPLTSPQPTHLLN